MSEKKWENIPEDLVRGIVKETEEVEEETLEELLEKFPERGIFVCEKDFLIFSAGDELKMRKTNGVLEAKKIKNAKAIIGVTGEKWNIVSQENINEFLECFSLKDDKVKDNEEEIGEKPVPDFVETERATKNIEKEELEKDWNKLEDDMYNELYEKLEKEYNEIDSEKAKKIYIEELKEKLEKFTIKKIDIDITDEEFLKNFGFDEGDKKNNKIILESYRKVVYRFLNDIRNTEKTEEISNEDYIEIEKEVDKENLEEERQKIIEKLEELGSKGYIDKNKQKELGEELEEVEMKIKGWELKENFIDQFRDGEGVYVFLKKIGKDLEEDQIEIGNRNIVDEIWESTTEEERGKLVDMMVDFAIENNLSKDEIRDLSKIIEPSKHIGKMDTYKWLYESEIEKIEGKWSRLEDFLKRDVESLREDYNKPLIKKSVIASIKEKMENYTANEKYMEDFLDMTKIEFTAENKKRLSDLALKLYGDLLKELESEPEPEPEVPEDIEIPEKSEEEKRREAEKSKYREIAGKSRDKMWNQVTETNKEIADNPEIPDEDMEKIEDKRSKQTVRAVMADVGRGSYEETPKKRGECYKAVGEALDAALKEMQIKHERKKIGLTEAKTKAVENFGIVSNEEIEKMVFQRKNQQTGESEKGWRGAYDYILRKLSKNKTEKNEGDDEIKFKKTVSLEFLEIIGKDGLEEALEDEELKDGGYVNIEDKNDVEKIAKKLLGKDGGNLGDLKKRIMKLKFWRKDFEGLVREKEKETDLNEDAVDVMGDSLPTGTPETDNEDEHSELEEIKELISEEKHDIDKVENKKDLMELLFSLMRYTGTIPRTGGMAIVDRNLNTYLRPTDKPDFLEMRDSAKSVEPQELRKYYEKLIDKIEEIENKNDNGEDPEEGKESDIIEISEDDKKGMEKLLNNSEIKRINDARDWNQLIHEIENRKIEASDRLDNPAITKIHEMLGIILDNFDLNEGKFKKSSYNDNRSRLNDFQANCPLEIDNNKNVNNFISAVQYKISALLAKEMGEKKDLDKKSSTEHEKIDLAIKDLDEEKLKSLWNILIKMPQRNKISEMFGEGKFNKEVIKNITDGEISFEDIKHLTVEEINKKIDTQIKRLIK